MKKYRDFKKWQFEQLKKAIDEGNINLAKQILNKKPTIDVWGKHKPKKKKGKG